MDMFKIGLKKVFSVIVILAFTTVNTVYGKAFHIGCVNYFTLRPTSIGAIAGGNEALAARLNEKLISKVEHRGKDEDGGINKIARIAILSYRTRDLKQGIGRGLLPLRMVGAEIAADYDVPFMEDSFFKIEVMPLLREKIKDLSKSEKLPAPESGRISIEDLWRKWTIRTIPDWRKSCREQGIADDIIEHYGRTRSLSLIDYNDYRYLKSLLDGSALIVALLFHGFVHAVVDRQGTGSMSAEQIEDYILEIAPIEDVKRALKNTKEIDRYNKEQNISEQKSRLNRIHSTLRRISKTIERGYRRRIYNTLLKNLQKVNLELNYMQAEPENKEKFIEILKYRHSLTGRLSSVVLKHSDSLKLLQDLAKHDLRRYIDYAAETGIASGEVATKSLEIAGRNIDAWFSSSNYIPAYIQQGLVRGMLEGRSEDIIYDYAGNIKSEGWKEFGTAGIRSEVVQSSFETIRDLELEEFAKNDNDPRVPILTGPYLINSVSLLKQAMTIIKLIGFIEHKLETGEWPDEVNEKERQKWPKKFDKEFIENIRRKTISIAYDSRLNGRYSAYLLASVFLQNGFRVNLFDKPSGVPGGVIVSNGADFFGELAEGFDFNSVEGSVFGVLISASHSEPWFNGFKVFLGHLRSQVDKSIKQMLEDTMGKISYDSMHTPLEALADKSIEDLEKVLETNHERLTWIGSDERIKDHNYCKGRFVPFYPLYYEYLRKRSPLAHFGGEELRKIIEARGILKVLYTAFFGAGAILAANLPSFLNKMGYKKVDVVKKQTDEWNGKFPGHRTPDPGIVEGWMSNLWNYIEQEAGSDFSNIKEAVNDLNQIEVGVATDPDIDRAGIMLAIPKGVRGNIKEEFIDWIKEHIDDKDIKSKVIIALRGLNDKLLLTANDAWTFMAYYKLKIMEESGLLKKDRLYIIEKSHVTTSGLERVARYFRNKGYHVYVVDAYVGFTDIGEKSRDLFAVAKAAWHLRDAIERGEDLEQALSDLLKTYKEVKSHVPYETAGVEIIDNAIKDVMEYKKESTPELKVKCLSTLNTIAHMEILMGVEESNGYGELGYYNPENDRVEGAHIAEKDGSLAAYEFLGLLSYGKAVLNDRSGYQMYTDMLEELGWTATDNQYLRYPGFKGKEQKLSCISAIEKILAAVVQKMLDGKEKPVLFGKYPVSEVKIYRNEKYDKDTYLGFPEEGVRFCITTPSDFVASSTYRPSATGDNNRDYNWVEVEKPEDAVNIEAYRERVRKELDNMVEAFFGKPADTKGKNAPDADNPRFLVALRDADSYSKIIELIKKTLGVTEVFTEAEEKLYKAVMDYTKSPEIEEKISRNIEAWQEYLQTEEARDYQEKVSFFVNGRLKAEIPKAFAIAWQASLVRYLSHLVKEEGRIKANIFCDDLQIAEFVAKRTPDIEIEIVSSPEKGIVYEMLWRAEETVRAVKEVLAQSRPDISAGWVEAIIKAHTHSTPRAVEEHKRTQRFAEQVALIHDLVKIYRDNLQRAVLIYNPYEKPERAPEGLTDMTEVIIAVEDTPGVLGREGKSIEKFKGNIMVEGFWSYDIGEIDGKKHAVLIFEIEKDRKGGGRFKNFNPIIKQYIEEGASVFTRDIDAEGNVVLKPETLATLQAQRAAVTQEAEKMLKQIHQLIGLPLKTKAAELDYLANKSGLFDDWDDVFNYFANLEFEEPVYQIRNVKTFDYVPVPLFAGYTDKNGVSKKVFCGVDDLKEGKAAINAEDIPGTTTIRAMLDEKWREGALDKLEIRPVKELSSTMIGKDAIDQTKEDNRDAYYMQRGVFASQQHIKFAFLNRETRLRFDITIMRPGVFGKEGEFIHTSGHFHNPKWIPEIYQVIYGRAGYMLQRTNEDLKTEDVKNPADIERAIMVEAEAGEPVVILPGYGHVTTNLDPDRPLVMVNWLTWDQSSQYSAFKRGAVDKDGNLIGIGGACWYAVLGEDEPYNSNPALGEGKGKYHNIQKLEVVKPVASVPLLGLQKDKPIYSIIEDEETFLRLAKYLSEPLRDEFEDITPENVFEQFKPIREIPAPSVPQQAEGTVGPGAMSLMERPNKLFDEAMGILASKTVPLDVEGLEKAAELLEDSAIDYSIIASEEGTHQEAAKINLQYTLDTAVSIRNILTARRIQELEERKPELREPFALLIDKTKPYASQLKLARSIGEIEEIEKRFGCKIIEFNPKEDDIRTLLAQHGFTPDRAMSIAGVESHEKLREAGVGLLAIEGFIKMHYFDLASLTGLAKSILFMRICKDWRTKGKFKNFASLIFRKLTGQHLTDWDINSYRVNFVLMVHLPEPTVVYTNKDLRNLHMQAKAVLMAA